MSKPRNGYPSKLKIGDKVYRIKFVKQIRECKKPASQKGATVGLHDPNRLEILIKNGQSHDEIVKTLIHEIFHAFQVEYDINTSHKSVYQTEEALFDFICANSEELFK